MFISYFCLFRFPPLPSLQPQSESFSLRSNHLLNPLPSTVALELLDGFKDDRSASTISSSPLSISPHSCAAPKWQILAFNDGSVTIIPLLLM
ncbi:uncharacterized protein G2W53_026901 [Senna tora]|uniref:Uncharacterized protein n=1 Tax=Senna tora TaxID=362788 RepID=A0A834THW6_9FABA|nr:uncharacterized protein G2W53_026901 [Senna tora]